MVWTILKARLKIYELLMDVMLLILWAIFHLSQISKMFPNSADPNFWICDHDETPLPWLNYNTAQIDLKNYLF